MALKIDRLHQDCYTYNSKLMLFAKNTSHSQVLTLRIDVFPTSWRDGEDVKEDENTSANRHAPHTLSYNAIIITYVWENDNRCK